MLHCVAAAALCVNTPTNEQWFSLFVPRHADVTLHLTRCVWTGVGPHSHWTRGVKKWSYIGPILTHKYCLVRAGWMDSVAATMGIFASEFASLLATHPVWTWPYARELQEKAQLCAAYPGYRVLWVTGRKGIPKWVIPKCSKVLNNPDCLASRSSIMPNVCNGKFCSQVCPSCGFQVTCEIITKTPFVLDSESKLDLDFIP